ncbi:DHA2 family efflux MFS transporter permease subunit [Niveispirillum sp. SYP-B3756]|uniref:DHA2 family efflux MFS transporter permease subunit n=1 Tax=Niveispirillum sp. SYP-B3756 TaxID=2662178 RepID=UPI001290F6E0|nr:DHA2 family efflux MFS transporter permease subunit [Niveispirillum sp. SYP-B3756]MQP68005.1 DHA2 family efflux MFS transporter permease subunit [Niveispirillum sp. SYP-B3756]
MSASKQSVEVKHRGLITLSIMLATVMQVLDTTIANVALPSMQGSLGAAQDSITWVLTSYIVAAAIMTPVTGWLADRVGLKTLFITSVGGFVLFSMLCGIATSLEEMVAFRLLQGVFGAPLVPLSQTVLLNINPKERHGQAMALWGTGIMVGPIIGPTLGGYLTEMLDWRWVFYINLPIGIVAFVGMLIWLPRSTTRPRGFDFLGFALLSLAVGGLQMMLDRGEQLDWFASTEIWLEAALALSAFWAFVIHILTAEKPFIEPRILRDRNLAVGLVLIFVVGVIVLAAMALLPPLLQRLMGYPTITTGLVIAPRGVGVMVSMIAVGRLVQRVDARLMILAGLALTAWSLHLMTEYTIVMGMGPIITSGIIQGLGLGLIFVPLSTLAFATLAPQDRTDAASLFSLLRNLGSSVGVSAVTSLLAQNTQINHAELGAFINPFRVQLDPYLALLGTISPAKGLAMVDAMVNQQAAMIAYLNDFKLMMLVTLGIAPLLLLLRKPARRAAAGDDHPAVME